MNPSAPSKWLVDAISSPRPLTDIVSRWSLDGPKNGAPADNSPEAKLYGWALGKGQHHPNLHVVLQTKEGTWSHPLSSSRPDVVKNVIGQEPAGQKELICGFVHTLPKKLFTDGGVTLGFETEGTIHPAVRIRLTAEAKPAPAPQTKSAS
jgi:hypothetical protein